jgi:hypothetical protein
VLVVLYLSALVARNQKLLMVVVFKWQRGLRLKEGGVQLQSLVERGAVKLEAR